MDRQRETQAKKKETSKPNRKERKKIGERRGMIKASRHTDGQLDRQMKGQRLERARENDRDEDSSQ